MKRVLAVLSLVMVLGVGAFAATTKNADCPGCDNCPSCPDGCCPGK
jgi:hypothetical protein